MTDGERLVQLMLEMPEEDWLAGPRLGLGDWLEENGQLEQAAHVRGMEPLRPRLQVLGDRPGMLGRLDVEFATEQSDDEAFTGAVQDDKGVVYIEWGFHPRLGIHWRAEVPIALSHEVWFSLDRWPPGKAVVLVRYRIIASVTGEQDTFNHNWHLDYVGEIASRARVLQEMVHGKA